jgi:hypothetical protein
MMKYLLYLLVPLLLLSGWLYLIQPRMIFFPYRDLLATPVDWGMQYEDVQLQSEDGIALHGWYLPSTGSNRVLLFFHGNAGNISHRGESLAIFHRLGLNVLIIDYRGYGRSEGHPDEPGLYRDADTAWRYLRDTKGFSARQIIIFGRSLGGAVAARLTAQLEPASQPGGLILESTLSSARDMARELFPLLSWITPLRFNFDTFESLKSIHCPLLVLHSPEDEIMPFEQGQKIFHAAKPPKTFHTMRGDHNSGFLLSQPEYEQALAGFINKLATDP